MISPECTPEELTKWKSWLANFGLDLYTTRMDKWDTENTLLGHGHYPVSIKYKGKFLPEEVTP